MSRGWYLLLLFLPATFSAEQDTPPVAFCSSVRSRCPQCTSLHHSVCSPTPTALYDARKPTFLCCTVSADNHFLPRQHASLCCKYCDSSLTPSPPTTTPITNPAPISAMRTGKQNDEAQSTRCLCARLCGRQQKSYFVISPR